MDTWQAIKTIRVVREFTDQGVEAEAIDRILNAGRRAGSSKNEQRWAFIVVRDRELLRQLAKVGRFAGHLARAAVAIALVTPNESGSRQRSIMWDLGRAAQNMVLAAWELGIGSVPATAHDHELAGKLLGLPTGQRCDFLLSFGYSADPKKLSDPNRPGGRKALAELVHEERWSKD